jgi:hypothetical protein
MAIAALLDVVLEAGLEPARYCHQGIFMPIHEAGSALRVLLQSILFSWESYTWVPAFTMKKEREHGVCA